MRLLSIFIKFYRILKNSLNYLLDRTIDLTNLVVMDYYSLPWPKAQALIKRLCVEIGNVSLALKQFPRLSSYQLPGNDWKMIYVGSEDNLRVIQNLFCDLGETPELLGRIAIWKLARQSQRWLQEEADLVVLELSPAYRLRKQALLQFQVPAWIQQIFTIPEPPEQLLTEKNGKGLRRVKKAIRAGYTCRLSHAESDLKFFYQRMYLPHISQRHGNLALLTPYQDLKRWFDRGGLVQVLKDGSPVAGAIGYISNHTYYSIEGGILDADPELFQQGIHVFNTWCEILQAIEQGVHQFDIGGTRPWASNGSYTHKKLWGARDVKRKRVIPTWHFLANHLPASLSQQLEKIGFISEEQGQFRQVTVGIERPAVTLFHYVNVEELGANSDRSGRNASHAG